MDWAFVIREIQEVLFHRRIPARRFFILKSMGKIRVLASNQRVITSFFDLQVAMHQRTLLFRSPTDMSLWVVGFPMAR